MAHCSDPQCTAATLTDTVGTGGTAESVAVGSDHSPIFAGVKPVGPTREGLSHCTSVVCPGFVTADGTKANWLYQSVTLGADGLPFIAFSGGLTAAPGQDNAGLSVEHCANEFCSDLFSRR